MIKLYGFPNSRSTRIGWLLEELGLDYEYIPVNLMAGEGQTAGYQAINPAGKVPAIVDDEVTLSESGAILIYLCDKYTTSRLIPGIDSPQRGYFLQWVHFALTELEQPLWTQAKHTFALPEERRVEAVKETAAWEFQKALALLSTGLAENNYILGDEFSAADILLAHTLLWGQAFKQPITQQNLLSYAERVTARTALAAARNKEQSAIDKKAT